MADPTTRVKSISERDQMLTEEELLEACMARVHPELREALYVSLLPKTSCTAMSRELGCSNTYEQCEAILILDFFEPTHDGPMRSVIPLVVDVYTARLAFRYRHHSWIYEYFTHNTYEDVVCAPECLRPEAVSPPNTWLLSPQSTRSWKPGFPVAWIFTDQMWPLLPNRSRFV